jgi:hypothetical protein
MNAFLSFRWQGILFYLATVVIASGQSTPTSQPVAQPLLPSTLQPVSPSQAALQNFQQQRAALMQAREALVAQGATPQQLAAWQQQNSGQFAALQQQAQAISAASALRVMPTNRQPNIPANASPVLRDFMTTRAQLANALAQIHNQLVQSMPSNASAAQIGLMQQQAMQLFQQQHANDLQLQAQRARAMANTSAPTTLRTPPPLRIPSNASPQLRAFLTTKYQLMQGQVALQNQYANAAPAVRQAAMQQWRQQNAALTQQLQQQAQALSQVAATPTPN